MDKQGSDSLRNMIIALVVLIVLILAFSPWKYFGPWRNITDTPEVVAMKQQKAIDELTEMVGRCASSASAEEAEDFCKKDRIAYGISKQDLSQPVQDKIQYWNLTPGETCIQPFYLADDPGMVDLVRGRCFP